MTQQPHSTKPLNSIAIRRPPSHPRWLWLALLGSSAVLHSVLAMAAMPLLGRLVNPAEDVASMPIELVELATIEPTDSPQSDAMPSEPIAPSPDAAISSPTKIVGPMPPSQQAATVPPEPEPELAPEQPSKAMTPSIAPPLVATPSTIPSPESVPAATPAPPPAAAPAPPLQPAESDFLTVPIDRPPPDVSATLPTPENSVDPSGLAQVDVNQARAPIRLVASLETERISTESADDMPEQLAAPVGDPVGNPVGNPVGDPVGEVFQQDVATLGDAACLNAVTPAVLQAIGTRVGVQVATNVEGQVVQTILQTSSQNPDYDRLVECLVQHWNFNPAQTQNQPVPSQALRVWVTIDPRTPSQE
jgi:outer membrane biosynthesis protein TonB